MASPFFFLKDEVVAGGLVVVLVGVEVPNHFVSLESFFFHWTSFFVIVLFTVFKRNVLNIWSVDFTTKR